MPEEKRITPGYRTGDSAELLSEISGLTEKSRGAAQRLTEAFAAEEAAEVGGLRRLIGRLKGVLPERAAESSTKSDSSPVATSPVSSKAKAAKIETGKSVRHGKDEGDKRSKRGEDDVIPEAKVAKECERVCTEMDRRPDTRLPERVISHYEHQRRPVTRRAIRTYLVFGDLQRELKDRCGLGMRDRLSQPAFVALPEAAEAVVKAGLTSGGWNQEAACAEEARQLNRLGWLEKGKVATPSGAATTSTSTPPDSVAAPAEEERPELQRIKVCVAEAIMTDAGQFRKVSNRYAEAVATRLTAKSVLEADQPKAAMAIAADDWEQIARAVATHLKDRGFKLVPDTDPGYEQVATLAGVLVVRFIEWNPKPDGNVPAHVFIEAARLRGDLNQAIITV